jgi:hypothetical protein
VETICKHCKGRGLYFFPFGALLLVLAALLFWLCYLGARNVWNLRNSFDIFRSLFSGILGVYLVSLSLQRSMWFAECRHCRRPRLSMQRDPSASNQLQIQYDYLCPVCSYNLRYQYIGKRCPECGTIIQLNDAST